MSNNFRTCRVVVTMEKNKILSVTFHTIKTFLILSNDKISSFNKKRHITQDAILDFILDIAVVHNLIINTMTLHNKKLYAIVIYYKYKDKIIKIPIESPL